MTTMEQSERKVAILVADGFEQVELTTPRKALDAAGFVTEIVSPNLGSEVQGFNHQEKGDAFPVDKSVGRAKAEDYCGLLLPGGVFNPDQLRSNPKVIDFVRQFFDVGKPVAAICHGPWTLIDAGVVAGRRLTSYASIKTDLVNAGAQWEDSPVVVDLGLVTSRSPQDLPAFCAKMIQAFESGPGRNSAEAVMRAKLNELIADIRVAMLTTKEADGTLHSRPMATLSTKRLDGNLWFFTSLKSGKSHEVNAEHQVNLSYADPKMNRYVSVTGRAQLVRDRQKAEELWTPLVKAWFPAGLDDPDLGLLRVQVERAEYWDAPAGKALVMLGLAKSFITGQPYKGFGTQHETIDLETGRAERVSPAAEKERDAPRAESRSASAESTEPGNSEAAAATQRTAAAKNDAADREDKRPEPKKAESKKAEPTKAEPTKAEPTKAEPTKAEPTKAEPKKAEPKKTSNGVAARAVKKTAAPARSPRA